MASLKSTKSSSSNSLTSLDSDLLPLVAATASAVSSSLTSSSSSRPLPISQPSHTSRPFSSSAHVAQSAPTLSWIPPPAPSSRPRVASVEPPPMTLPPSPPIWSPAQEPPPSSSSSSSSAIAIQQPTPTISHLQPQRYSRSLSNYSSSAPSHHADHLSSLAELRPRATEQRGRQGDEEEEAQGGLAIATPAPSPAPPGLELSKSPTILGLLTQQEDGAARGGEGQGLYRRPSLMESHIAEGEEEEDERRGDRGGGAGDDLQFSISLEVGDEGGEGEDREVNIDDGLY